MVTGPFINSIEIYRFARRTLRSGELDFLCAAQYSGRIAQKRCNVPNRTEEITMMQSFEDAGKYGKEFMDNGMKSFTTVSNALQAIATEAADYSQKSFEASSANVEKLLGAKSLEKAIEIQADYAKSAYEGFVAQATKMGELYAEVAKDAYKPFEAMIAKAK